MTERRRGAALEEALLDAAWSELTEGGYASLTMEAVAARAGTSRPVIYRRWPDKTDLIRAAVARVLGRNRPRVPDTGTLRGDVIALMHEVNRTRVGLITALSVQLAEYYEATGTSPSDLRTLINSEQPGGIDTICERAIERGEVDPARLTRRIRSLPFDLLRQEVLTYMRAASDEAITEIVDTIFLPLTRTPAEESPAPAGRGVVDHTAAR